MVRNKLVQITYKADKRVGSFFAFQTAGPRGRGSSSSGWVWAVAKQSLTLAQIQTPTACLTLIVTPPSSPNTDGNEHRGRNTY